MRRIQKIAYLIPQFPGQTHIFFWREIRAQEDLGVKVEIFSTRKPPPGLIAHDWSEQAMARTDYLGEMRLPDVVLSLLWLPGLVPWRDIWREGLGLLRDFAISAPAARRLKRQCRKLDIAHVHAHSCGRAALVAALAHRMGGPRYSLTLHGPLSDYGPGQGYKWRNAAFATVITDHLLHEVQRDLAGNLPDRIAVQAMGIDTDVLKRDAPYQAADPAGEIRLFTCARLNVVKGHQDLMQAVRLLVDAGLNVRLDIAGEDDDGGSGFRAVLQERIAELDLSSHVRLLGAIDADEVKARLTQAHIFVLASWHEPLGVAYMEAMSCEVPTIGTDAGGVPELIRDGIDGVLVAPKDPDALAAAIRRLIENPDEARRLAAAGRARVEAGFRSAKGAETLLDEIAHLPD